MIPTRDSQAGLDFLLRSASRFREFPITVGLADSSRSEALPADESFQRVTDTTGSPPFIRLHAGWRTFNPMDRIVDTAEHGSLEVGHQPCDSHFRLKIDVTKTRDGAQCPVNQALAINRTTGVARSAINSGSGHQKHPEKISKSSAEKRALGAVIGVSRIGSERRQSNKITGERSRKPRVKCSGITLSVRKP